MPPADSLLRVPVADARALLLARALEESDRSGRLTSARERERAGESGHGEDEVAQLVQRARALVDLAGGRAGGIRALESGATTGAGAAWLAPAALVLGLATHLLGGRYVNVLAFPLLGALTWNAVVYVASLVDWLRRAGRRGEHTRRAGGLVRGLLESRIGAHLIRLAPGGRAGEGATVTAIGARFADLWLAAARPLIGARVRTGLHLAAAALVAGLVAGMYVRGLAFEYRAQWESTFLTEETARALLSTLLGPASRLSGIELPDLAGIRAPDGSGEAAAWIHLWALTAGLFVLVPRLALAAVEATCASRLAHALPLDLSEAYWRRLRGPGGGAGTRVVVLPYGAQLAPRPADRLRLLLHDLLGARADVVLGTALEYGAEVDTVAVPDGRGCLVAVFTLAQTPELEVHGRFLAELRSRVEPGGRLLVLVDGSAYAERLGDSATARERLHERRRAWDRAAREAGLQPLHLDLGAGVDAATLERAEVVLWTAPDGEGEA